MTKRFAMETAASLRDVSVVEKAKERALYEEPFVCKGNTFA